VTGGRVVSSSSGFNERYTGLTALGRIILHKRVLVNFRCWVGWIDTISIEISLCQAEGYGVFPMPALSKSWRNLAFCSISRCVAGTSAGSMAGLLLALATTAHETQPREIRGANFGQVFLDHGNVNQIV